MAVNATSSLNRCVQEFMRVSKVPVLPGAVFNVGDLMKWDATNHVATPVANDGTDAALSATAALILGVVDDQQPFASLGGALPLNITNIIVKGIFNFLVDDSSTYFPGDRVTIGQNAQTVRKTGASAGNSVGVVAPENFFRVSASNVTGITPGVGGTILIALQAQDIAVLASY